MTSFPAQRLGYLTAACYGTASRPTIVVFDAKMVRTPATRTQPKQLPIGIDYVIVNGHSSSTAASTRECCPAGPAEGPGVDVGVVNRMSPRQLNRCVPSSRWRQRGPHTAQVI
jgi:hypothetical protein